MLSPAPFDLGRTAHAHSMRRSDGVMATVQRELDFEQILLDGGQPVGDERENGAH